MKSTSSVLSRQGKKLLGGITSQYSSGFNIFILLSRLLVIHGMVASELVGGEALHILLLKLSPPHL